VNRQVDSIDFVKLLISLSHCMTNIWHNLKPLFIMVGIVLVTLTGSRVILVFLWYSRVQETSALGFVMSQGLRFDFVLLGMITVIPLIIFVLLAWNRFTHWLWLILLSAYVPLIIMIVLFLELATPPFAEQFDARPNVLFFDYLNRPVEIFNMLWGAYRLQLVLGVAVVLVAGYLLHRGIRRVLINAQPVSIVKALPLSLVLMLLCGMAIRSTLDHRPVNPSVVARTTDSLVNELPLSSMYSVAYAAYELSYEDSGGARYGSMDAQKAIQIVRDNMHIPEALFVHESGTTWHKFEPTLQHPQPKNLVIILQESLGAEFVGSMGGLDLTPNIDALREQGMSFDRLYATGTRSVRGIEAITTGFLPTASRSVVKLAKSQRDFFSIAGFLKNIGYDTSFIYGGESHFDNMRRFFMSNGFDAVVDEKDYVGPVFMGSWGVSDEDLMRRAHAEFEKKKDKPFFSLVFSSSNHTPFEFPDGRIVLFDEKKQTVNNAVKYADYAIGEFFKLARQSSYWKDTLFLVVSDHNSRVYGSALVPIKRFHIPGIILGDGIEPSHEKRIASQVDLGPTLLSLMGVSGLSPMPGLDFTKLDPDFPGRAIMQFNAIQAYMEDDQVVVLQKKLEPLTFRFDGDQLIKTPAPSITLIDKALAHATWAANAYQNGEYKWTFARNPSAASSQSQ